MTRFLCGFCSGSCLIMGALVWDTAPTWVLACFGTSSFFFGVLGLTE